ncbi:MAG: SpoIIE family protein phosphatase [Ignavibacteriae bacterium]|nr:SpoIIE family protein phosphatase [Ignavibacteriota bacterium]
MSRLRRIIYILIPTLSFLGVYIYDVTQYATRVEVGDGMYVREILMIISFTLLFLLLQDRRGQRVRGIPKELGRLLLVGAFLASITALASFLSSSGNPDDVRQISVKAIDGFLSFAVGIPLGMFAIITLLTIKDLVLYKRRKGAWRNFLIYLVLLVLACFSTLPLLTVEFALIASSITFLAIIMVIVNSFKQNWIVTLSRREKIYSIIYSALLFCVFTLLAVLSENEFGQKALRTISAPLQHFAFLNFIFGAIYSGMAFVSTLFHLPTAEQYERKQSELSSLHNLTRLVSQVFDFQDLVNSVTHMTLDVVGANRAWLEIRKKKEVSSGLAFDIASQQNISAEQIEAVTGNGASPLRDLLVDSKKFLIVDDVPNDRRTKHLKGSDIKIASLVSVPLISHNELIGILHATKDIEYGFDQDDVDVLTTFADNVTIAIENSRLISESLERERLKQEIMVAQQMQKKLLPEHPPQFPSLQFAASWEPSMEVGGDYYDFVNLGSNKVGLVVGDVAGKGVSAAFYMAEVKGIFQSLSKLCKSPKELLVRANETLMGSLERKAFISIVYAIFDYVKGTVQLARAGHCPVVYVSATKQELIRPNGLGLGLTDGEIFQQSTEGSIIRLTDGDVCVFYTDGITEARNAEGDEYGYERLLQVVTSTRNESAQHIMTTLLNEVKAHTGYQSFADDMTLVVAKWVGPTQSK